MRLISATRWPWLVTIIIVGLLSVTLALYLPQTLILLLPALLLLLLERMQTHAAMDALAKQIVAGELSSKVGVRTGAWGALCHAVNGLLQQQRLEQRIRSLSPDLPQPVLNHLLQASLDDHATTYKATVLSISSNGSGGVPLDWWQEIATVAQTEAERHNGLIQGSGGNMVLVFGAFEHHGRAPGLRAALQTAEALWDTCEENAGATQGRLSLAIASGTVYAGVLPGLGYSALGVPVEQAFRLQHIAALHPQFTLLCDEETYVALRYLQHDLGRAVGSDISFSEYEDRWVQIDARMLQSDSVPQTVYGWKRWSLVGGQ